MTPPRALVLELLEDRALLSGPGDTPPFGHTQKADPVQTSSRHSSEAHGPTRTEERIRFEPVQVPIVVWIDLPTSFASDSLPVKDSAPAAGQSTLASPQATQEVLPAEARYVPSESVPSTAFLAEDAVDTPLSPISGLLPDFRLLPSLQPPEDEPDSKATVATSPQSATVLSAKRESPLHSLESSVTDRRSRFHSPSPAEPIELLALPWESSDSEPLAGTLAAGAHLDTAVPVVSRDRREATDASVGWQAMVDQLFSLDIEDDYEAHSSTSHTTVPDFELDEVDGDPDVSRPNLPGEPSRPGLRTQLLAILSEELGADPQPNPSVDGKLTRLGWPISIAVLGGGILALRRRHWRLWRRLGRQLGQQDQSDTE